MPPVPRRTPTARPFMAACCLVLITVSLVYAPAAVAQPAAPSLALVPQNAAFYTASLRIGEQIEIVKNSKWWEQVNQWDLVLQMKFMAQFALQNPGNPAGQIQQMLEQPENKQLLALLQDMISDEIFCYGEADVNEALGLAVNLMNTMQYGPMSYELFGRQSGLSQDEFMAKVMLEALSEQKGKLQVPDMVIGFKLSDAEPATQQLARLEELVKMQLNNNPDLAIIRDKFARTQVAGSEFLTLELDGSLVPWNEIPFEEIEEQPGQFDELKQKLRELKLVVSLGIHQGYALLSVGKSNDHLAKLGQGEVLADHPKLAPLKGKGTQRFTDIFYISEGLIGTVAARPKDVDDLVELARNLLPLVDELPDEAKKELVDDAEELGKDIKGFIPQQGPQLLFSYMTDRGFETFHYNWSENLTLDGSQPLTLLDHLGGSPMCAFLARGQQHPEYYDLLVKWLKKGHGYFTEYAVPTMSDREREEYEKFAEIAYPLLGKMDEVNRKLLIPALSEGQGALVFDTSLKTKQWHAMLPPMTEPIAMPSPAIVMGLKDADSFRQALGEYRNIINEVMKKAHELNPGEVPDFQLPPAKMRQLNGTEIYYYTMPPEFGVYDRVAPNVAVTDKMAVFSVVPRHTVKLTTPTPLAVDGGPIANAVSRPLAAVSHFDWSNFVDMVVPWVNEGVRAFMRNQAAAFGGDDVPQDGDSEVAKQILAQVAQGAEYLKAFRGYSSVTYVEDDALVTHGEARFVDLD